MFTNYLDISCNPMGLKLFYLVSPLNIYPNYSGWELRVLMF